MEENFYEGAAPPFDSARRDGTHLPPPPCQRCQRKNKDAASDTAPLTRAHSHPLAPSQ